MAKQDYSIVTEVSGEEVTPAQIDRLAQRYYWAGDLSRGRDVLEVACGAGQGLGHLASVARSIRAGDITPSLVARASAHYGARVPLSIMDAQNLPFEDSSLDVVILFEAIYYLASADRFIAEANRVLRPGGQILIATANKDLFDFNPSPFSVKYFGVTELYELLRKCGFTAAFLGGSPVSTDGLKQRIVRSMKRTAVALRLIPRSMSGKRLLKRLVFGKLMTMPAELHAGMPYTAPVPLSPTVPDAMHQVIYCVATKA